MLLLIVLLCWARRHIASVVSLAPSRGAIILAAWFALATSHGVDAEVPGEFPSPSDSRSPPPTEPLPTTEAEVKGHQRLREGTLVPATTGRVIVLGRRWMFVPLAEPERGSATGRSMRLPRLMLSENLMLQRIVEAIRVDSGDDHWTITGRITEFFEENRLIVLSAKRATD